MPRASGANALLNAGLEATYGAATSAKIIQLPFVSANIGGDQALIENNLLGRGREPQDPILDVVNDAGDVVVPIDVRNIWFWLKLLLGDPVTTTAKANGKLDFAAQPVAGSTINVGGTVWTFIAGASAGTNIGIKTTLPLTLVEAATVLNASADVQTAKVTYTSSAASLGLEFDTAGLTGNAFTIAVSSNSNATASGANLRNGGYKHVFKTGAATLPSSVVEIGFPEVPSYGRNGGVSANAIKIALATSGLLDGTVSLIGQNELTYPAPLDANPTVFDTIRFGQFTGEITRNGVALGEITSGDFNYTNSLDAVRVIRRDGAIAGTDVGSIKVTGTINSRFSNTILLDQAQSQLPCALTYGWFTPSGYSLMVDIPRVFLPRPKRQVSGPGGIEIPFAWQAAKDSTAGYSCAITLINDIPAANYAA